MSADTSEALIVKLLTTNGRFDTNTTSDFASRMTEDLNKVQDGMGEKVGMMLRFVFAGLTAFIYPFIANWLLSLVLLSLVPILAIMGGIMGKVGTITIIIMMIIITIIRS